MIQYQHGSVETGGARLISRIIEWGYDETQHPRMRIVSAQSITQQHMHGRRLQIMAGPRYEQAMRGGDRYRGRDKKSGAATAQFGLDT